MDNLLKAIDIPPFEKGRRMSRIAGYPAMKTPTGRRLDTIPVAAEK